MIYISCGLNQKFIIDLLENANESITYTFKGKKGIQMMFEVNTEDLDSAMKLAKQMIKDTKIGSVMYFQITAGQIC